MLSIIVVLPLVFGTLLCAAAGRSETPARRALTAWLAGGVTAAALGLLLMQAPAVFAGQVLLNQTPWIPEIGLNLGFRLDGLALMFALLITGVGLLIILYAAWYLHHDDPAGRFYPVLMLFMAAMLGIVLSDNLLLLVVFWELTSISSFLLVGYWSHKAEARAGARMALAVTGGGGLALLAGVILLGQIGGSYELSELLTRGDQVKAHALYPVALGLILLGCFTKSAQFPFHFWLPEAMAAPTPVSAYLHSATMVKAGIFLLARLYPVIGGTELFQAVVCTAGLVTMAFAAYVAVFKHDLKGLLAYSTVSHLGLIVFLIGLNSPLSAVAAVFHILNHATFKAGLFMTAGIIDHETGSRDMRRLNGLWKLMPWTGALAMVAAGAMAGVPLLNGFLSKEMFFAEALAQQSTPVMQWLLPAGATLAAVFSVAYSLRFIHDVFFNGAPVGLPKTPHEPPRFMRVPVEILVVLCLVVGLAPALSVGPLLAVGAQAALFGGFEGTLPAYKLAIWHGLNLPLAMSALALAGGVALYFVLQRRVNLHRLERAPATPKTGGRDLFALSLGLGRGAARRLTAELQNDSLQRYLWVLVAVAVVAGALPFIGAGMPGAPTRMPDGPAVSFGFAVLWSVGMVATLATVWLHRQRLLALLLLGAVGLVVSLAFVYFSAPDLALTQLLVEMATIVLMMLALHWLPAESPPARRGNALRRTRDGVVALAAGAGVAALAWAVLALPFDPISPYFLATTQSLGGGANTVNVILVDYRGYDTLGEITVLGVAALIIHALLSGWRAPPSAPAGGSGAIGPLAPAPNDAHPLMLALISRLLLPLAVMVAVFLFLRGHNLPGGGFIAGLVLAIALVLQFVANGQHFVAQRMGTDYPAWVAAGLLIAGATGIGSWFFGAPFLTSSYDYPLWPLFGAVPLASAALFDLGVFLTVVGATMTALVAMGRLTPAEPQGAAP